MSFSYIIPEDKKRSKLFSRHKLHHALVGKLVEIKLSSYSVVLVSVVDVVLSLQQLFPHIVALNLPPARRHQKTARTFFGPTRRRHELPPRTSAKVDSGS